MSILVVDKVITIEQCLDLQNIFDVFCVDDINQQGYKNVPGIPVLDGRIIGKAGFEDIANDISNIILQIAENIFNKKLSLISFGYVQMHAGANNGLHADSVQIDGTPYPDGNMVDYSAIIYLNEIDRDFSGGSISFPSQGLTVRPKAGTAIIFKGDTDHMHSVKTVTSGVRKTIILFFENC